MGLADPRARGRISSRSMVLGAIGLAGLLVLIAQIGWDAVFQSIQIAGWGGYAALMASQLMLTIPLALAWRCICPQLSLAVLLRARLLRDAAANCLPFTALGGFAFGAVVLTRETRVGWRLALTATAVDAIMEFAGQVLFIGLGLVVLTTARTQSALIGPVSAVLATGVFVASLALVLVGRSTRLRCLFLRRLEARLDDGRPSDSTSIEHLLDRMFQRRWRLVQSAGCHLLAWLGTGLVTWLTLILLGQRIGVMPAIAIEALQTAVRALSFFVPAAIGVQEAGYVLVAAAFGVGAGPAVALSLLRRARDMGVGLPVLACSQLAAARCFRRRSVNKTGDVL